MPFFLLCILGKTLLREGERMSRKSIVFLPTYSLFHRDLPFNAVIERTFENIGSDSLKLQMERSLLFPDA